MHSSTAMSSARSSIASATRCSSFLRMVAGMPRQALNASAAAVAARSISSALPRATLASTAPSIGDLVSKVAPEIEGTTLPSIRCPMPSAFNFSSSGTARSRLALNTSAFGVTLSMGRLLLRSLRLRSVGLQRLMDVVALPAHLLVIDLHVERKREFAAGEYRIEIAGERLENMLAGLLAGGEVAALAKPQHHRQKCKLRIAVGDGVVLAAHRADAGASHGENPGLDGGLADHFAHLAHVDAGVEIGGIFEREMRHGFLLPGFDPGLGRYFAVMLRHRKCTPSPMGRGLG